MSAGILAGIALSQVPDLLKSLIGQIRGKGRMSMYGGRLPSKYNTFMGEWLRSKGSKGMTRAARNELFREGALAWKKAQGKGFCYPRGGTMFGAARRHRRRRHRLF